MHILYVPLFNYAKPLKFLKNLLTICLYYVKLDKSHGEVSEWFKELVLKTSDAKAPRVRISASPPLLFKSEYLLEINCPFGGR